jgi:hypothetical protein
MSDQQFLFQPACVVVGSVPEHISWSTIAPTLDPNLEAGGKILRLFDGNGEQINELQWTENPVRRGNEWVFVDADGTTIQVRQALPGDAVSTGFAPYSLPMKLLREKSRNPGMNGTQEQLMAAVNPDDDYVLTLLLVSPAGVYARYSQNWFEIASANSLGNCYLVGIEPEAIETYDAHDSRGTQVSIKAIPTIRDWVPQTDVAQVQVAEEVVEPVGEAPGNPVGVGLTSAGIMNLPTSLEQAELIEVALEAGLAHEEVRWAIERRLGQLKWDGEFPWN